MAFWLTCQVLLLALLPLSPSWASVGLGEGQIASATCLDSGDVHNGGSGDHGGAACAAFCLLANLTAVPQATKAAVLQPEPLRPPQSQMAQAGDPVPGPVAVAAPRGPPLGL